MRFVLLIFVLIYGKNRIKIENKSPFIHPPISDGTSGLWLREPVCKRYSTSHLSGSFACMMVMTAPVGSAITANFPTGISVMGT